MATSYPYPISDPIYFNGNIHYPISKLQDENVSYTNLNNYIELVIDDYGNNSYVSRKTEISTFYDFLISSHPIFNKIDDVYNDRSYPETNEYTNEVTYRYASDIFISGQTYFKYHPYSTDEKALKDNNFLANQTVQKRQVEQYVHDNALEINPVQYEDTMVQFEYYGWNKSLNDDENPRTDMLSFVALTRPSENCRIKKSPNADGIPLYHSDGFRVFSNTFATIVGKVNLPEGFNLSKQRKPYYTPENNLWVGVWWKNSLVAISELHNIVGNVAYFSIQMPMVMNELYYVVVPFKPNGFGTTLASDSTVEHDMFKNIRVNTFAIFYYSKIQLNNEEPDVYFGN